ncbi:MAG: zinc-ribbon domain-containing protein, partial [Verrucomicrobiota bacterium]
MKTYHCICGQLIFFDNTQCVQCQQELGFIPNSLTLGTITPTIENLWCVSSSLQDSLLYKKCLNFLEHQNCNWMIPSTSPEEYCLSCRLNDVI